MQKINQLNRFKKVISIVTITSFCLQIILFNIHTINTISATLIRKEIDIENRIGKNVSSYPILIDMSTLQYINSNQMENDCRDIKFLDADLSNIPFWLESGCGTNQTLIWVKPSSVSTGISNIYIEFGKGLGRVSTSSLSSVFPTLATNNNSLWIASNDLNLNDGDKISNIQDRSIYNNNLSQNNINHQPVKTTKIENGLAGIEFTSSDQIILNNNVNNISKIPLTSNLILHTDNTNGKNNILSIKNKNVEFDKFNIVKVNSDSRKGNNIIETQIDFRNDNNNSLVDLDIDHTFGYEGNKNMNIQVGISENKIQTRYNKTFRSDSFNYTPANNFNSIEVGGFRGIIQEIIVFNRELSEIENQEITRYLDIKYKTDKEDISTYINENQLFNMEFGENSHYLQPFRAEMKTEYAKDFVNGIGVGTGLNYLNANQNTYYKYLSDHGINKIRLEIPWGAIDYDSGFFKHEFETYLKNNLNAAKNFNIRPLLLLTYNDTEPTPNKVLEYTVTSPINTGDKVISINETIDIIPYFTGLNQATPNTMGEIMAGNTIVNKTPSTIEFSFPITQNYAIGDKIQLYVLKYRPFSVENFPSYQGTIDGFLEFVDLVSQIAVDELGTTDQTDKGYDIEINNEIDFGYSFNYINLYYEEEIVDTSQEIEAPEYLPIILNDHRIGKENFEGVNITNGFASQSTFNSGQDEYLDGMSKQSYSGYFEMPADNQNRNLVDINGNDNDFIPDYVSWHPESSIGGSGINRENLMRDLVTFDNYIYDNLHGRYSKIINEERVEVPIYLTEAGLGQSLDTNFNQTNLNSETKELDFKAKMLTRLYPFLLGKGSEAVYAYYGGAQNGLNPSNNESDLLNKYFGLLSRENIEYFKNDTTGNYPSNSSFSAKTMSIIKNMTNKMKDGIDYSDFSKRDIYLRSWSSNNPINLIEGNNIEGVLPVTSVDKFTFLPFQVNKNKFVIPYYTMTPNMAENIAEENFSLDVYGISGQNANIFVYDPYLGQNLTNFSVNGNQGDGLQVTVPTSDYARFLIIEESSLNQPPIELDGFIYASVLNTSSAPTVSIKVLLEGALINNNGSYNQTMRTTISQYNSNINNNYVDEVTVEVLNNQKNILKTRNFYIDNNGNLIDKLDFSNQLDFDLPPGDYYFNIKHRNHIGIGTNASINLINNSSTMIDFSTNNNTIFGNQKQLQNGKFALHFGDVNNNSIRNSGDRNVIISASSAIFTYSNNDVNLDGVVNSTDRNLIINSSTVIEYLN